MDRRPRIPFTGSYEIREVSIDGRIRDQVAEVQVSQTFHNPGSFPLESEFLFPLPEEGAIQNFVLMVDGRELPGRLLPKDEARRIYEDIVRTKRDPALLEYVGRGLYRTSVFPIPAGADRKVTMRYTRLCKRDRDVIEFSYPLSTQKFTAKPIQRLVVKVSIQSREAIKSVYCPSDDAAIDRSGDHDVRVRLERRDVVPSNDFRLVYTLSDSAISASVLSFRPTESEDGYFLVLASPEVKAADSKPISKTVVFVLDRSGSMAGKKIEQARKALKSVLNNLRDEDLFNIVVYDDRVETFKPELQRYGTSSRQEAERFVDNIREGGSTNIDSALKTALAMIQDTSRPGYVLFMTDGLPTSGETRELAIAENCRKANQRRARLFCFGVGYDVDARLLDRLSGGNSGTSEYVKPDEDIEAHVGRFYAKMTSPVLADLHIELTGIDINRSYPRDIPDLFEGGQIVWAGRYRQSGRTTIRITGKVGSERRSLEFPAELAGSSQEQAMSSSSGSGPCAGSATSSTRSTCKAKTKSWSTSWSRSAPSTESSRPTRRSWPMNVCHCTRMRANADQARRRPRITQRSERRGRRSAKSVQAGLHESHAGTRRRGSIGTIRVGSRRETAPPAPLSRVRKGVDSRRAGTARTAWEAE